MTTFHEMMNKISFRAVAGWAHREADLWSLRDILFELQTDVQELGAVSYRALNNMKLNDAAEGAASNTRLFAEMLEKDIQTIETYCRSRGIERGNK